MNIFLTMKMNGHACFLASSNSKFHFLVSADSAILNRFSAWNIKHDSNDI